LLRIIHGSYQCGLDADLCSQALNKLCSLYRQRDAYDQIISICLSLLQQLPGSINAHYFLAASYQVQGENVLGLQHYRKVLSLDSNHAAAHLHSGILLERLHEYEQAAHHFRMSIQLKPRTVEAYIQLGLLSFKYSSLLDEGFKALQYATELAPNNADVYYMLARICEMTNRLPEAERYLQECLKLSPEHPQSQRLMATLLRRQGQINEAIAQLESTTISPKDSLLAMEIHFELGKLYERNQDSAHAYEHYLQGNQIMSQLPEASHIDKEVYLNLIQDIRKSFTKESISTWSVPYHRFDQAVSEPVFLVGFPRSGTTLLDQILSSHPSLQVIEEQPMIENLTRKLVNTQTGYVVRLGDLGSTEILELRQHYFNDAASYLENGNNTAFIDKFPLNIVHLGLIIRLFPTSRIILALRHPCDVCLSCFMQSFSPNMAMANFYNLEDSARLYAEVMGLWQHYEKLLPMNYQVVRYEDMVDDFEGETRRLLEFLGLKWDPGVLEYHSNARSRGHINTPSYDQVTEKIYSHARYRWKRWENQLRPAMNILSPFIEYFGY